MTYLGIPAVLCFDEPEYNILLEDSALLQRQSKKEYLLILVKGDMATRIVHVTKA